jgi:hypothetical protein
MISASHYHCLEVIFQREIQLFPVFGHFFFFIIEKSHSDIKASRLLWVCVLVFVLVCLGR